MSHSEGGSFFDKLASLFAGTAKSGAGSDGRKSDSSKKSARGAGRAAGQELDDDNGAETAAVDNLDCCSNRVHIAYRGVSDDRLYLAENRTSNEVKFFRPIGLRVFCAECRKRLL